MSRINTELARKVRDQILLHPETHNQGIFLERNEVCGTTGCVAGWAGYLDPTITVDMRGPEGPRPVLDGKVILWTTAGELALGIDRYIDPLTDDDWSGEILRSQDLFSGVNTRGEVLAALDRIVKAGEEQDR